MIESIKIFIFQQLNILVVVIPKCEEVDKYLLCNFDYNIHYIHYRKCRYVQNIFFKYCKNNLII